MEKLKLQLGAETNTYTRAHTQVCYILRVCAIREEFDEISAKVSLTDEGMFLLQQVILLAI